MTTMSLSITTYNILAQAYVKLDWYPNCTPEMIDATRRRTALCEYITKRLATLPSDVICLQEVEVEVFDMLGERLVDHRGELAMKSGGKPDGCATFMRRDLPRRQLQALHYEDGTHHVALFLTTELDGRSLCVANTHLRWHPPNTPPEEHVGRGQMLELLERIETLSSNCEGFVLCGDFNAESDAPLITAARERGFLDAYADTPAHTCNPNGRSKRIDYLLHSANLSCRPRAIRMIDDKTTLPSLEEPSDHLAITGVFDWK